MSRGYRITYIFMRLVSKREVKGRSRYKTTSEEGRLTRLGFEAVRWNLAKYSGFQLKRIVWERRGSDRKNEFVSKQLNEKVRKTNDLVDEPGRKVCMALRGRWKVGGSAKDTLERGGGVQNE